MLFHLFFYIDFLFLSVFRKYSLPPLLIFINRFSAAFARCLFLYLRTTTVPSPSLHSLISAVVIHLIILANVCLLNHLVAFQRVL